VVTIFTTKFKNKNILWISGQTVIVSLHSNNWLVFITVMECLLRGSN